MTGNAQTSSLPAELGSLGSRSWDRQRQSHIILAAAPQHCSFPPLRVCCCSHLLPSAGYSPLELSARLFVPYETRAISGEGKGERVGRAAEAIRAVSPSPRGLPRGRSVPRALPGRQLRAPGQREPRQPSQMEL